MVSLSEFFLCNEQHSPCSGHNRLTVLNGERTLSLLLGLILQNWMFWQHQQGVVCSYHFVWLLSFESLMYLRLIPFFGNIVQWSQYYNLWSAHVNTSKKGYYEGTIVLFILRILGTMNNSNYGELMKLILIYLSVMGISSCFDFKNCRQRIMLFVGIRWNLWISLWWANYLTLLL